MRVANFCMECGEQLARKGWRARFGSSLCDHCAQRLGTFASFRSLVAVVLVASYLGLNLVVTAVAIREVLRQPHILLNWRDALFAQHGNAVAMLGICLVLFPKLALGLSGFETGVVVMPLIEPQDVAGRPSETEVSPPHEPVPVLLAEGLQGARSQSRRR